MQAKPEVGLTAEEAVRAQLDALADNDHPWQAPQELPAWESHAEHVTESSLTVKQAQSWPDDTV